MNVQYCHFEASEVELLLCFSAEILYPKKFYTLSFTSLFFGKQIYIAFFEFDMFLNKLIIVFTVITMKTVNK